MIPVATSEDLADTLGLLRRLAGLTQTAVAEQLGCHANRIGEYENHRRRVSFRVAVKHLAALGYGLAIVPLDEDGPETTLSAHESAEQASGVDGPRGGDSRAAKSRSGGAA